MLGDNIVEGTLCPSTSVQLVNHSQVLPPATGQSLADHVNGLSAAGPALVLPGISLRTTRQGLSPESPGPLCPSASEQSAATQAHGLPPATGQSPAGHVHGLPTTAPALARSDSMVKGTLC